MPTYTFGPAAVFVEATGELAIGATGVLRPTDGGDPVQVFDLNGSPLPNVQVGPQGAHQAFTAGIPDGILDFGSVLLPTFSLEQIRAGLTALTVANEALTAALTSVSRIVFSADPSDPNAPRPAIDGPLVWLHGVEPVNADDELDYWLPLGAISPYGGGSTGGGGSMTADPDDPDAYVFSGQLVADPNDPDAYIF